MRTVTQTQITRRAALIPALITALITAWGWPAPGRADPGHETVPVIIDLDTVTLEGLSLHLVGRITDLGGAPLFLSALSGEHVQSAELSAPVVAQAFGMAPFDARLSLGPDWPDLMVLVFDFGPSGRLPLLIDLSSLRR